MGKGREVGDRIWDLFSSVKLAVVLFSLIALTSIVGTLLEQQSAPEKNLAILSKLLGESLAPAAYEVFDAMGFLDMYHSWWFVALLMFFALNLLICSIDRFPSIYKLVRDPIRPLEEEHYRALPIRRELTLKGGPEKAKEAVLKASGLKFAEAMKEGEKGSPTLLWERGRFTRFGVFVTHMSFIIILIGALIGIFFGFKGNVNIPEGAGYAFALARVGPLTNAEYDERGIILEAIHQADGVVAVAAGRLGVSVERLRARMKRLGVVPLGFIVRLDDFEVSFYGNSDMPKDYRSTLTVVDGGRAVVTKDIEVNDPLKYKGITFYQSSYGILEEASDVEFFLRVTSIAGMSETVRAHQGEKVRIPGTDVMLSVAGWSPALSFDSKGTPYTAGSLMNNPAARIQIGEGSRSYAKWILKRYPDTWRLDSGHIVELQDVWGAQYTGLQVRRDPGVWIVYLGCLIISIGLYMAFFMSHRRIWVRLRAEKGGTRVLLAASANKNRESFERKVDRMAALLREGGKK